MPIALANAARIALEAAADVFEPPPPVDFLVWAEDNIVFPQGSPFPGPYNRRKFPFFDEPLRALSPDDPCRIVTIKKSAQIGGTVLANVFTGGTMAMDPCDFMFTHPTEDNAARWSKLKLAPFIKQTPSLSKLFSGVSRDGSDSVLFKQRIDGRGSILISGANSPASLSQVSMPRQVQDDLSKWEKNAAGDPEGQADSRSRAFAFAKILKVSTPLIEPGCRISAAFEAGSQEMPFVPCPHCGEMQMLEWANMLAVLDEAKPEEACFTCIACGAFIEEHHRPRMLAGFEWRAMRPERKAYHRSFWIWSAYSELQSWKLIAEEWIKAAKDPAKQRVFLNDTAGLAYKATGEAPPWEALRDRAAASSYPRGLIPAGFPVLTLGLDCQKDRVEWQAVAWGRDGRRAIIDHGVVPGHVSEPATHLLLDALLAQSWPNMAGNRIMPDRAAIDGNAWTEDVFAFARRHPTSRLIMVRGVGSELAPKFARVKKERSQTTGKLLKYASRFYNFGASVLKMALYRHLAKADPLERGAVLFPRGLEDEFFRQLTAESRVEKKDKKGFVTYQWVKDPNQANEGLDTHLQAEAAALRFGIEGLPEAVWDRLTLERETPPPTAAQLDLEDMLGAPAVPVAAAAQPGDEPERAATPPEPPRPVNAPAPAPARHRQVRRSSFMN